MSTVPIPGEPYLACMLDAVRRHYVGEPHPDGDGRVLRSQTVKRIDGNVWAIMLDYERFGGVKDA